MTISKERLARLKEQHRYWVEAGFLAYSPTNEEMGELIANTEKLEKLRAGVEKLAEGAEGRRDQEILRALLEETK